MKGHTQNKLSKKRIEATSRAQMNQDKPSCIYTCIEGRRLKDVMQCRYYGVDNYHKPSTKPSTMPGMMPSMSTFEEELMMPSWSRAEKKQDDKHNCAFPWLARKINSN